MSSTKKPRKCSACNKLSDHSYLNNTCDWCGGEFYENIKIEWEFIEWVEKSTGEAQLVGVDDSGNNYEATGVVGVGEIVEVYDISRVI